jgi:hypothetical protein
MKALAESLQINPENLNDAKSDPDLAALRNTDEGRTLLSSIVKSDAPLASVVLLNSR